MTSAMFSALRTATFNKTIKRLSGFVTLKYRHYTGQASQTCQPKNFICPTNQCNNDHANNPNGANYWWHAECKDIMVEKRTYTSNLRNISPPSRGAATRTSEARSENGPTLITSSLL